MGSLQVDSPQVSMTQVQDFVLMVPAPLTDGVLATSRYFDMFKVCQFPSPVQSVSGVRPHKLSPTGKNPCKRPIENVGLSSGFVHPVFLMIRRRLWRLGKPRRVYCGPSFLDAPCTTFVLS
jgi:hypothetical protein